MEQISRKWISQKEAMLYLGVKGDFLKSLRQSGELAYSKIGKTILYSIKEIDKVVKSHYIVKPKE